MLHSGFLEGLLGPQRDMLVQREKAPKQEGIRGDEKGSRGMAVEMMCTVAVNC